MYYTYHLQVTHTITLIGSDRLCVNCNDCYGVVYIAPNLRITCATCRYGKTNCPHVQHLTDVCTRSELDVPEELQQYARLLSQSLTPSMTKQYSDNRCLSKSKIPFDLPTDLSAVLHLPFSERFNNYT